jgi:hypothetical protein
VVLAGSSLNEGKKDYFAKSLVYLGTAKRAVFYGRREYDYILLIFDYYYGRPIPLHLSHIL